MAYPSRHNPLPQQYGLRRSGEREYEVYVNVDFTAAANYDGNLRTKQELNAHYKRFMRQCFRTHENNLVDEYQRKIKLKVYDEAGSPLEAAPPLIKIDIVGANARSRSLAYAKNIDCPTVVHEVLHLTGLSDEYEETLIGYNSTETRTGAPPAYDCRPIGPRDSIMRDQWTALNNGQGIYSGHVNLIIYPNCRRYNERYLACVKYAYKTSAANRNSGFRLFDCATRIPDHCRDENWVRIAQ
jgi:hypothetical protein